MQCKINTSQRTKLHHWKSSRDCMPVVRGARVYKRGREHEICLLPLYSCPHFSCAKVKEAPSHFRDTIQSDKALEGGVDQSRWGVCGLRRRHGKGRVLSAKEWTFSPRLEVPYPLCKLKSVKLTTINTQKAIKPRQYFIAQCNILSLKLFTGKRVGWKYAYLCHSLNIMFQILLKMFLLDVTQWNWCVAGREIFSESTSVQHFISHSAKT